LSKQHVDIWEHAALLYHGYEWQAAADTFYFLAHKLGDTEERTLCFLNTALIQARLGDFEAAATTLEEAVAIDQDYLMTAFIVGLVRYELRDAAKAEACFEICMDGLVHHDIDHNDVRMSFVLDRPMVHGNLRAVREAQFRAKVTGSDLALMNSIPLECIFEAPLRFSQVDGVETTSQSLSDNISLLDDLPERMQGITLVGPAKDFPRRNVPSPGEWFKSLRSPASSTITSPAEGPLSSIPEHGETTSPAIYSPATLYSSAVPSTKAALRKRITWHRRPSTPYTPRDARADSESTRDLARFIRTAGQAQLHDLVPRNPRGEYVPVDELATFINAHSPEKIQEAVSGNRIQLNQHLVQNFTLNRQLSSVVSSPTSLQHVETHSEIPAPIVQFARPHDELESHWSSSTTSEPISPFTLPSPVVSTFQVLQPQAYDPAEPKKTRREIGIREGEISPPSMQRYDFGGHRPPIFRKLVKQERPAPNEHSERERDHTLQLLEGTLPPMSERIAKASRLRSMDKPLPLVPAAKDGETSSSSASSPKSVATENFFEKVLGKVKTETRILRH
jgi:hypothetical protein